MRHNQSDKADQAAVAHRRTDHQGSGHQEKHVHHLDRYAHGLGRLGAQAEQVHGIGEEEEKHKAWCQHCRQQQHLMDIGHAHVAHQPEDDVVQPGVLSNRDQKHDESGAEGVDHDSRKQQRVLLDHRLPRSHDQEQGQRPRTARKSGESHTRETGEVQQNADDGADRRSPGDAQDVRLRQGISEQRLKHQTTKGKGCSHQSCQQDSRETNLPDDRGQQRISLCAAQLPLQNGEQFSAGRTDGNPGGQAAEQEDKQYRGNNCESSDDVRNAPSHLPSLNSSG